MTTTSIMPAQSRARGVYRPYHIDRGYEMLDDKLELLGAKVKRVLDLESGMAED